MQEFDLPKHAPKTYEISDDILDSQTKSVLVLEDDAAFADTLKDALEIHGYRVTTVPTGAEGVKHVLASDFDAIVCDMVMPNFPGDMFYKAVERARPHLCKRFIFITGHKDNPKVVDFINQSGRLSLWKPFEMDQLSVALKSLAY